MALHSLTDLTDVTPQSLQDALKHAASEPLPKGSVHSFPASRVSSWFTAHNKPDAQDAAAVTQVSDVDGDEGREIFAAGRGTHLVLRLGYDDALAAITDPVVVVLGVDENGEVERLRNENGGATGTLATDTTNDAEDGTLKYTTPNDNAIFDIRGCHSLVVGVETALAGTGTVTNSVLQGKLI